MNQHIPHARLTAGPIGPVLISLSAPMLIGILSMMAFNLIDAFFIARLGTLQLAAITLTFPVVMVVGTFTLGLGVGAMAVISRSIGKGDQTRIRRYATDALSLSAVCVVLMTILGLATVEPLFGSLGATSALMPFVKQYMYIWYPGMIFYVVPMIGSNVMRATGDTGTPSAIMVAGMILNAALDPIFIFGWGPIPRFEIAGAAVASIITRALTLIATVWILHSREHLLVRLWPGMKNLIESWKTILAIGLPVAVSNAVVPVAMGIITRIVTGFGHEAVAGFGVATRVEAIGFALIIALSTGVSPFVGQNFGAGRIDRIRKGLLFSKIFSIAWGVALAVIFLFFGTWFAVCFDNNPSVVASASLYLWLVPISLGMRGIHQIIWTSLNVLGRPYDSLFLELILTFGFWIPFALAGAHAAQLPGLYAGISCANICAGVVAILWGDRVIGRMG